MQYCLSYKGKPLGEPMDRDLAEAMLIQMSACMKTLEIVEAPLRAEPSVRLPEALPLISADLPVSV